MDKVVIYDVSAILYSGGLASYSRNWCNSVGFPTGGLYKLLNYLFRDIKNKDNVIFALDSNPNNYLRKKVYPDYKANRNNKDSLDKERIDLQYQLLIDKLPKLGIAYIQKDGYEADDIIYSLVGAIKDKQILIRADDSDLKDTMIINNLVSMESVTGKGIFTPKRKEIYNKICYGDITDNYKGLSTAELNYFRKFASIYPDVSILGNRYDKELLEICENNYEIANNINRNIYLATPKFINIDKIPETNINEDEMKFFLNILGCKSILKRIYKEERDYSSPRIKSELIRISTLISQDLRQKLMSTNKKITKSNNNEVKEVDISSNTDSIWDTMDDINKVLGI